MESIEPNIAVPKTVEEAVKCFLEDENERKNNYENVINFLKNNPEEIGEFCLQIRDIYGEKDRSTALILVAILIEKLLLKLKN